LNLIEQRFRWQGKEYTVKLEHATESLRAEVDGRAHELRRIAAPEGTLILELQGKLHRIAFARDSDSLLLTQGGAAYRLERVDPLRAPRVLQHHEHGLEAPMPGLVRLVAVEAGASVQRGQTLVVVEAMKMEIRITAPGPSRIVKISCRVGDQVERGQVLVELDSIGDSKQ
jgi:3-methylcrotonyl-CoA carboxylase alpha subunit